MKKCAKVGSPRRRMGTLYSLPGRRREITSSSEIFSQKWRTCTRFACGAFIDEPELGALEVNEPVKITWDALPSKTWVGKNREHSRSR